MPKLQPISHKEFVSRLKKFGYEGPFSGGKHLFMLKDTSRLTIPNPHRKEIGIDLLARILRQAEISKDDWINIE